VTQKPVERSVAISNMEDALLALLNTAEIRGNFSDSANGREMFRRALLRKARGYGRAVESLARGRHQAFGEGFAFFRWHYCICHHTTYGANLPTEWLRPDFKGWLGWWDILQDISRL
jgi:hypothetical protein